ncbi:MAG: hypothetical protein WBA89_24925 [Microcoleus sp.]
MSLWYFTVSSYLDQRSPSKNLPETVKPGAGFHPGAAFAGFSAFFGEFWEISYLNGKISFVGEIPVFCGRKLP